MLFRTSGLLALALFSISCEPSEKEWTDLKSELQVIREDDQKHRRLLDSVGKKFGWQSQEIRDLIELQYHADSVNFRKIEEIIDDFGYPPRSKVGEQSETPFMVLQHSADSIMIEYYNIVVEAAGKGDLPRKDVALFQDKVLRLRKEPQEFGSQLWIETKTDPVTKSTYDSLFLWEIRDPANVNKRRLEVGLDSLETYLERFDIDPALGYAIRKRN